MMGIAMSVLLGICVVMLIIEIISTATTTRKGK